MSLSGQLKSRDFEVHQSLSFKKNETNHGPWFNWKLLPVRLERDSISSGDEEQGKKNMQRGKSGRIFLTADKLLTV